MNLQNKKQIQINWVFAAIGIITIIGLVMRIKACFWGKPLTLHTDEWAVVDKAIEMLSRHSWEAHSYNRPDNFEIKCDSLLFTAYSWLKYHMPAYEAFNDHRFDFYLIARLYTSLFGTAMIPLSSLYVGKLMDNKYKGIIQVFSSILFCFAPVFIMHSAYATPDIVLAFFVLLFSYYSVDFLETGEKKPFILCSIIVGIGLTIKYPAAMLCVPLALMVFYKIGIVDRQIKRVPAFAFQSIGLVFSTVFIIAPNLITDVRTVISYLIYESRSEHLGQDNLGFWGNVKYYFETIQNHIGQITVVLFVLGLIYIFLHKGSRWLSLIVGAIFWGGMSILPLHWGRWGIPMYPYYVICVSMGVAFLVEVLSSKKIQKRIPSVSLYSGLCLFAGVIACNMIISGCCYVQYSSLTEMRVKALNDLQSMGITAEKCLSEGYTPFAPTGEEWAKVDKFFITTEGVRPVLSAATKEYYIISNTFVNRFKKHPEKYPNENKIYSEINNTFEIVYQQRGNGNYSVNKKVLSNLLQSLKYLLKEKSTSGDTITAYKLNPCYISIHSVEGQYLAASDEIKGGEINVSSEKYLWVLFKNENGTYTPLSGNSGLALDVAHGIYAPDGIIELWDPIGGDPQEWSIIFKDTYCNILANDSLSLTLDNGSIILSEFVDSNNQRWIIE